MSSSIVQVTRCQGRCQKQSDEVNIYFQCMSVNHYHHESQNWYEHEWKPEHLKTRTQGTLERLYPIENIYLKISLIRILTQRNSLQSLLCQLVISSVMMAKLQAGTPSIYEHLSVKYMSLLLCLSVKLVHLCVPPLCVSVSPTLYIFVSPHKWDTGQWVEPN